MDREQGREVNRHRWLRRTLAVGAVYNLGFACAILLVPGPITALLALPRPGALFYEQLLAVFLALSAGTYGLAARSVDRYRGNVAIAVGARLVGGLVLAVNGLRQDWHPTLLLLGGLDLVFAVAHAWTGRALWHRPPASPVSPTTVAPPISDGR